MLKRGNMAIYKSSFNQKPEKQEKPKKEKPEKIKLPKEKVRKNINVKPSLVSLLISATLFVVCCSFSSYCLDLFILLFQVRRR